MPPVDDELARAATEFDTLAELRADIEARLQEQLSDELEARFREDALDALVDASTVEVRRGAGRRRAPPSSGTGSRTRSSGGRSAGDLPPAHRPDARAAAASAAGRGATGRSRASSCSRRRPTQLGLEVADEEIEELIREQATRPARMPTRRSRQLRETRRLRAAARRPPPAKRPRPDRRRGQADPGRARAGEREALDTREGKGRDRYEDMDARKRGDQSMSPMSP